FFFQAEDGIRDFHVTGVQTCALPISAFKRCGPVAAIGSWAVGLAVFAFTRYGIDVSSLAEDQATAIQVGGPVVCSIIAFVVIGLVAPWRNARSDELVDAIAQDEPATEQVR